MTKKTGLASIPWWPTCITVQSTNPCRYKNCREKFPDKQGGCSALSCGVD